MLYVALLCNFYLLLKAAKRSYSFYTDDVLAVKAALILSVLECMNLLWLFPERIRAGGGPFVPFLLLGIVNYFIFCYGERFRKHVNALKQSKYRVLYLLFTILYVGATVMLLVLRRDI